MRHQACGIQLEKFKYQTLSTSPNGIMKAVSRDGVKETHNQTFCSLWWSKLRSQI